MPPTNHWFTCAGICALDWLPAICFPAFHFALFSVIFHCLLRVRFIHPNVSRPQCIFVDVRCWAECNKMHICSTSESRTVERVDLISVELCVRMCRSGDEPTFIWAIRGKLMRNVCARIYNFDSIHTTVTETEPRTWFSSGNAIEDNFSAILLC